jgi:hypothetical protein
VDAADGRRWSDGLVDRACEAYRHPTDPTRLYAGLTGSGAYRVDPDGGGPLPARTVWCEMELLGGGWTWLGQQAASATTFLGGAARGTPGVAPFSIDATGIPFREIAIVNLTHGHVHTRDYSVTATWVGANTNQRHASMPQQFRQGQYGPSATMDCVDYSYGSDTLAYACDNDGGRGQKGHIAAYAGEFCSGGRLDNTWAWTDGSTCSYRGQAYTWGIAIR